MTKETPKMTTRKEATREEITQALRDDYEASILIEMAKTFGFQLKTGKSQLYATCQTCGKRMNLHTYGRGSLSERIAEHGGRHQRARRG